MSNSKYCGLDKYYDKRHGWFLISFSEAKGSLAEGILEVLRNGYVMKVVDDGLRKYYMLFSIGLDTSGCTALFLCREKLYDLLHNKCGVHYFTKMSLKEYMSNRKYQNAIDYVLEKTQRDEYNVDGWSIALTINTDGDFEFVEVKDACI